MVESIPRDRYQNATKQGPLSKCNQAPQKDSLLVALTMIKMTAATIVCAC
jgi:hypothetical protein